MSVEVRLAQVVRASHGRLVALLAARTGDIAGAEDAVAAAYRAALEHWRQRGIPDKPDAWLMTAARNHLADQRKSAFQRTKVSLHGDDGEIMEIPVPAIGGDAEDQQLPDERLKLMFAAAHPAIDAAVRAPLILQTVLGLQAAEIARLFCVPEATMAQRLTRAKVKIRDARIPFSIPGREVWGVRVECVLDALYGAYTAGLTDGPEHGTARCADCLHFADMLAALLDTEPEALGLAALMAFSAGRAPARYTAYGMFVALDMQDPRLWDAELTAHATRYLVIASRFQQYGRYQLEAAIHAVHADRLRTGVTDWLAIVQLYEGLAGLAPTRGVLVARAYAIFKLRGADAGLAALAGLADVEIVAYAPALACRANLREQKGELRSAAADFAAAAALVEPGPEHLHLQREAARVTAMIG
jgi:predicted RNA polymerase sigma factor